MIKRLSDNLVKVASAAGLVLLVIVAAATIADKIDVAIVGLALLQVLLLGVALLNWRSQQVTGTIGRTADVAQLDRAIANVALRCVDEARATERELGARIDSLREVLESQNR